jgi:hypothetical protein
MLRGASSGGAGIGLDFDRGDHLRDMTVADDLRRAALPAHALNKGQDSVDERMNKTRTLHAADNRVADSRKDHFRFTLVDKKLVR